MKDSGKHEIRLSYRCNNNCRFCEVADERERYIEPGLQEIKNALMADSTYQTAEFFGGEPMISPHFLKIMRLVTEQGKNSKINTNCRMCYYKEYAKRIAKENISEVSTSIESHRPQVHDYLTRMRGSFRQTVEGIKNLKKEGLEMNTTTVMMKQNIGELKETADFIIDALEVTKMRFSFLQIRGNVLKNMEVIARISEVRKELPALLEHTKQRGVKIVVDQGPMCVLEKGHGVFEARDHTSRGNRDMDILFKKTAKCRACKVEQLCPGVCKEYIEMFGDGELTPLERKEVREEELS